MVPFSLSGCAILPDRTVQLSLTGLANAVYALEASSDASNWSAVATITNATGVSQITDPSGGSGPSRKSSIAQSGAHKERRIDHNFLRENGNPHKCNGPERRHGKIIHSIWIKFTTDFSL
jgi:hypothetical protein